MEDCSIMKILLLVVSLLALCSTSANTALTNDYQWSIVTADAGYPKGYNYPVFVVNDQMWALNNGGWVSTDGKSWTKTTLPESSLKSAFQDYVFFKGQVYALGTMQGNVENMTLTSRIARTRNFQNWEVLTERSNLPDRVFYGSVVFRDKIWLFGGWDGKKYYNDIWNSDDGVVWKRVAEHAAWSARNVGIVLIFHNKLWFHGGGVNDGERSNNPNSENETWTSDDGVNWTQLKTKFEDHLSGTPVVYDEKIWLIGGNRNDGKFENAAFVSPDGVTWQRQPAPWSPRGGVAAWVYGDKLYMTGGKFSETVNGEIRFIYSNDVWVMSKTRDQQD